MRTIALAFAFSLLVLSLLGLSACSSDPHYEDVNYFEGRHGLVMTFMANSPPERLYPEQVLPITILLENQGAFSLTTSYPSSYKGYQHMPPLYAQATLIYDPFFFEEDSSSAFNAQRVRDSIFIEGKSPYWPGGEQRIITLGVLEVKSPGPKRIAADTDLKVSLCYPYETVLATEVCVAGNPYDERVQGCEVEDLSFSNQGAPVAVTFVDVESIPTGTRVVTIQTGRGPQEIIETSVRPVFRMTLRNVGDGQIVRGREYDEMSGCLSSGNDDIPVNTAVVYAYLGNVQLACSPSLTERIENDQGNAGLVKFYDGEGEVVCMIPPGQDIVTSVSYESVLQVYVDYVYQVRESVTVHIDDTLKAFAPPENEEYSCMDFDNDQDRCASFSKQYGSLYSNLNCYYCDSLKKCLTANCANCPGKTGVDTPTRRCVSPCPLTLPAAGGSLTADLLSVVLTCTDSTGTEAQDFHRCGCGEFVYYAVSSPEECAPETFTASRGTTVLGTRQDGVTTYTMSKSNPAWGNNSYLCVAGMTVDDRVSAPFPIYLES